MDKTAFDYYYRQVKSDLINERISELQYPNYKNEVLGFCVTSMYIEMLEHKVPIDELITNYKSFIPCKIWKEHWFLQRKVGKKLIEVEKSKKKHDPK